MKKRSFSKLCGLASLACVVLFAVDLTRDWLAYDNTLNSAPFSAWVLVDCICFLLPALVFFGLGLFLRMRSPK